MSEPKSLISERSPPEGGGILARSDKINKTIAKKIKYSELWKNNKQTIMDCMKSLIREQLEGVENNIDDIYLLEIFANDIHNLAILLSYMEADNFLMAVDFAKEHGIEFNGKNAVYMK